mgnify:CR=1 FL=1
MNDPASQLHENPRELSNVIKQEYGVNFNDFINQKKVTAFEQRIAVNDQQQFTLLSLAYEPGFNSKATLHRTFKKHKGVTPKEFVEKFK